MMTAAEDCYNSLSVSKNINSTATLIRRLLEACSFSNHLEVSFQWVFIRILAKIHLAHPRDFNTDEVQSMGLQFWKSIDNQYRKEFLQSFKIGSLIDLKEIEIVQCIKDKNFLMAAQKILKWNKQDKFELELIVEGVVGEKYPLKDGFLLKLIAKNPDLQKIAIAKAMKIKKLFLAEKLLKQFEGPSSDFQQSKEIHQKVKDSDFKPSQSGQTILKKGRKRLDVFFKKGNWMQIEAKLSDSPGFLKEYIQSILFARETEDIALSIIKRNYHLLKKFSDQEFEKVSPYFSNPPMKSFNYIENPLLTKDEYLPTEEAIGMAESNHYLHLSDLGYNEFNDVIFDASSDEHWGSAFHEIYISDVISISTESSWTNRYSKSDLLQIATKNKIYIFDANKFSKEKYYKDFWKCITEENRTIVGYNLDHHLNLVRKPFKNNPYSEISQGPSKECASYVDLHHIYPRKKQDLGAICKTIFKKPLSKFEKFSNWSIRPLRKAQLYSAALNAAIPLKLFEMQNKKNPEKSQELQEIDPPLLSKEVKRLLKISFIFIFGIMLSWDLYKKFY